MSPKQPQHATPQVSPVAAPVAWPRHVAALPQQNRGAGATDASTDAVVYFAERDGLVKIGTTGNLLDRLARLDAGKQSVGPTDTPVRLLAVMPGSHPVERAVHRLFELQRLTGEWFLLEPPLLDFVLAVRAASVDVWQRIERARSAKAAAADGFLSTVRSLYRSGETWLSWHRLAARLGNNATAEVVSAQVRAFGVRSVNGREGTRILRGAKLVEIEQAVRAQEAS